MLIHSVLKEQDSMPIVFLGMILEHQNFTTPLFITNKIPGMRTWEKKGR